MLNFLLLVASTLLMASMAAGLLAGYAARRDLLEVRAPARYGALLGLVAAATLALLKLNTGFVVREYYNLAILCVLLPAELLLYCLLAASRSLPPEKAAGPALAASFFLTSAAWAAFYLPDLFLYPPQFAVGVVNVVSSEFIINVSGYLCGLLLCLLLACSLFRVCAALPEKTLFPLFSLGFLFFLANQAITLGQILLVRGFLPRSPLLLRAIVFLLNEVVPASLFCLVATAGLCALLLWRRSRAAVIEGANPALRRKARSGMRRHSRWSRGALGALAAGLLLMTVGATFNTREVELSPPVEMPVTGEAVLLPVSLVGDGALHRFVYTSRRGVGVRYIVIKKSETAFGVGLDACEVCGPSGYFERKGQVVCILCDVVMNKATIGFAGGCNPVPLRFSIREGNLVINTADLEAEAIRFM
jgi:uncharacterized membrane protein